MITLIKYHLSINLTNFYFKQGCIRAFWHPKINQILVGLSDGKCRLYYDPNTSVRGALSCADRPVRRARQAEIIKEDMIISRNFCLKF